VDAGRSHHVDVISWIDFGEDRRHNTRFVDANEEFAGIEGEFRWCVRALGELVVADGYLDLYMGTCGKIANRALEGEKYYRPGINSSDNFLGKDLEGLKFVGQGWSC